MTAQVAMQMTQMNRSKKVSFVSGYPLVGNLSEWSKDRLGFLRRLAHEGDVVGLHFGPFPGILFNKPEHAHSILVEQAYSFNKGVTYPSIFRPVIGNGIFTSEGELHRYQRRVMAPSFQPRHIASYVEIFGHYGEQIQQSWADGCTIDINQEMTRISTSIICKVLFGADVLSETDELSTALIIASEYVARSFSRPIRLPYSWSTPRNRHMHKAVQFLRSRIQSFIDERRNTPMKHNDFLSLLLEARDKDGKPMSEELLMAECQTLFYAGLETTATALSWTWYLLCLHAEQYQKVQHEVDSILQGRTPTYEDLQHLPYCLQVIKEAIRLYPPGYALPRRALRDVEIDGYRVPKGTTVLVAPYTLHRREDYFPEPEQFHPERFTPEREKELPRYAYLPFGTGPRICIGQHFSMIESHLLLATIVQRVRFSLVPGQTIVPDPISHLVLRPAGKVNVVVQRK